MRLKSEEWTDQYSPLFHLSITGRDHYVGLTEKVTNDLLREKVTLYSSQEQTPAAAQLFGSEFTFSTNTLQWESVVKCRYRQNSLVRYGFWRQMYRNTNGIVISRVTCRVNKQ